MSRLNNNTFNKPKLLFVGVTECDECGQLFGVDFKSYGLNIFEYITSLRPKAVLKCPNENCDNAKTVDHFVTFVDN